MPITYNIASLSDPRKLSIRRRPPSRVPIFVPPPDLNYVSSSYSNTGYSLIDAFDYDYTPIPLLLNPLSGYVLENYVSREF